MPGAERDGVVVDCDVAVAMRDGVRLAADVFRPRVPGRFPAVLIRTPYDKHVAAGELGALGAWDPLWAARAGFVTVVQDVRGTYESEGCFRQFHDEAQDGVATIEWVVAQEWSNGSVAMTGASYLGATQLLAASHSPSGLGALVPSFTGSDYYDGWCYQGGAFQLGFALRWAAGIAYAQFVHRGSHSAEVTETPGSLEQIAGDFWTAYAELPMAAVARADSRLHEYAQWLAHPDRDHYWRAIAVRERYSAINVPALHITGWSDIFLRGALENYTSLRSHAATAHARCSQRLIVAPWGHGVPPTEVVGDIWFGREAGAAGVAKVAQWTREFIRGPLEGSPPADEPRVKLFIMGQNRWRDEDDWPLARAVPTRFYLRASGGLTREPPADDAPTEYLYDPARPLPTIGGNTLLPGSGFFMGPRDRRSIHDRADVLVYESAPLVRDTEVTGPVTASLHVSTSARDTDFTATLLDVYPDGRAIGIADGILRLRYRNGPERAELATPGEICAIEVDLVATSNVFKAGHRLGVEISSSNFPRFDRNPNHGGDIATASQADFVVARQSVFHGAGRASFVTLPIVGDA